jgi:hypothetical protein
MGKIVFCHDGDSNPQPLRLIFGIKTPNRILAFTAIRILERGTIKYYNMNNILDSIDFWKRTEYVLAVVKLTIWFFERLKILLKLFFSQNPLIFKHFSLSFREFKELKWLKSVPSGRGFESRAGQKNIFQIKYTRDVKSMTRVMESKQKDICRWSIDDLHWF